MGMKDTKGKEKLRYIPYEALKQVALVREFGTQKYGDAYGYMDVDPDDFVDAALRHLYKYLWKERDDEESGLSHLSHAACSILLAIDNLRAQGCLLSKEEVDKLLTPTELAKAYKESNKERDLETSYQEALKEMSNLNSEEYGSDS